MIPQILDHLWQSTLFAAAAGLLVLALRKNRAQVRYAVWFAASVKFLVPFSLLMGLGTILPAPSVPPGDANEWFSAVEQIGQPLAAPAANAQISASSLTQGRAYLPIVALALWGCGFSMVAIHWLVRWRRILALRLPARELNIGAVQSPAPVMSARGLLEPGVFGLLRPVLLLPEGIVDRLSPAQLNAIIDHELCHLRRRDNWTAAMHMAVETVFWFHPLVWWLGSRLIDERERACDEEVLRRGGDPNVYAEGILNVCKFYIESPLPCVPGVTGSDLKKRIEAIMRNRIAQGMNAPRKIAVALAATAAIVLPVLLGSVYSASAQSQDKDQLRFEVVSVKRSARQGGAGGFKSKQKGPGSVCDDAGSGPSAEDRIAANRAAQRAPTRRLCLDRITLLELIRDAYGIVGDADDLVTGGPDWLASDRFEIDARASAETPTFTMARYAEAPHVQQMLQALLADRFQLKVHRGPREFSVHLLTVAAKGHKLTPSTDPEAGRGRGLTRVPSGDWQLGVANLTLPEVAAFLWNMRNALGLRGPVVDRTGVQGRFDFTVRFANEANPESSGAPPFFKAMEELGLKFESAKVSLDVLVVDRAEQPSEN